MDIPMINEINENTNAAKKEILEAMPAAGATSAEVEAAKTAIIGAMPSGGDGMFVPVSRVSMLNIGITSAKDIVNVKGKGYVSGSVNGVVNTSDNTITMSVDGVTIFNGEQLGRIGPNTSGNVRMLFRFNKSFYLKVKGASDAKVSVYGSVFLEE